MRIFEILPRLDSNQDYLIQSQACYQLHHGAIWEIYFITKTDFDQWNFINTLSNCARCSPSISPCR